MAYGYDPVGNRIRQTERDLADAVLSDKQGVFDAVNRLTSLTDLARPEGDPARLTTLGYDRNGNQVSKTAGGATTEYRYDVRDKMVEVVQAASTLGRFQYDFEGRRSKKIGEEGIRQYVYDQTSLLVEYDEGLNQKAKYDYGSDRLISLFRSDEGLRFFSFDGLRSVTNLTDDSGNTAASYHWNAWGQPRFPAELELSVIRFGFTGYYFDRETDLYYAKARYLDAKLGRFLTQDLFLGTIDQPRSLHRYAYGWNRPTFFIDPTGREVRVTNALTVDGEGFVTATDETTVYGSPTHAQLAEMVGRGEITRAEAVFGQVAIQTRALATTTRDFEKSYARNVTDEAVGNVLETVTAPARTTFEGLANQDLGQVGLGLAEQGLAGAAPVVVKEGAGALVARFPVRVITIIDGRVITVIDGRRPRRGRARGWRACIAGS